MKRITLAFLFFTAITILSAQNFKVGDLIKLKNSVPVVKPESTIAVYSNDANNDKTLK